MAIEDKLKESFQVSLDQQSNVIYINFVQYDVKDGQRRAELLVEAVRQILKKDETKEYGALYEIDSSGAGSSDLGSAETRDTYLQLSKEKQILKSAIVIVSNPVIEALINMLTHVAGGQSRVKLFKNKNEALSWLKGN